MINEYVGPMNKIVGVNLTDTKDNWVNLVVTFNAANYNVCAKIFRENSKYGLNDGRISKLDISLGGVKIYNFDRGLDFDNAPKEVLDLVLKAFT